MRREKMAVIKLENISYSIMDREVFRGLNAEFSQGERIALVGDLASGRGDLLDLINGLVPPDSGAVTLFDSNINRINRVELDKLRNRTGFIFQNGALISNLKVIENVTLPLVYHTGMSDAEIFQRGISLLDLVGYDGDIWALPGLLPVFIRKEVAFARALALEPEIMIYDMFMEGLDSRQRKFMISLMEEIHVSRAGRLSIFTSNNVEEVKGIGFDRIFTIKDNALVVYEG